jgi:hypothetical protein
MPRRIRDAVLTMAVLLVLVAGAMGISPKLRAHWSVPAHVMSDAVVSSSEVARVYAGDNTYLMFFLVVAGVLFILMLRT